MGSYTVKETVRIVDPAQQCSVEAVPTLPTPFMFLEFSTPIPVVTPVGEGYAVYARDGGTYENDVWTVCLCAGGRILHFRTDQIRMHKNATFEIEVDKSVAEDK
jgi:hypothetical protein